MLGGIRLVIQLLDVYTFGKHIDISKMKIAGVNSSASFGKQLRTPLFEGSLSEISRNAFLRYPPSMVYVLRMVPGLSLSCDVKMDIFPLQYIYVTTLQHLMSQEHLFDDSFIEEK